MPLIEWSDNYSVGIETADIHHKKLSSMINSLYESMKSGDSHEVVAKILSALIVYTDKHFEYEEDLLKTHNYPGYEEQKHIELLEQVKELNEKFNSRTTTISIELLSFLKGWLIDHINGTDKKYTEFLHSKGVK